MMTFEAFNTYVTEVLDHEIPQDLLKGLNLGVIVVPRLERNKAERNFIIKGHYVQNKLGKQIILYYGSFRYLFANKTEDEWKDEILSTIKHEFTHHLEALAGQEDLAKMERYAAYLRAKRRRDHK